MKRSANDWCELTGIIILDPDGWDRKDPDFHFNWNFRQISFDEFWDRTTRSTVGRCSLSKASAWDSILNRILAGEIKP